MLVLLVVVLLQVELLMLDGTMLLLLRLSVAGFVMLLVVVMLLLLLILLLVLLLHVLMKVGGRLLVFVGRGLQVVVRLLVLLQMVVGLRYTHARHGTFAYGCPIRISSWPALVQLGDQTRQLT
jgi:hypothetical protein